MKWIAITLDGCVFHCKLTHWYFSFCARASLMIMIQHLRSCNTMAKPLTEWIHKEASWPASFLTLQLCNIFQPVFYGKQFILIDQGPKHDLETFVTFLLIKALKSLHAFLEYSKEGRARKTIPLLGEPPLGGRWVMIFKKYNRKQVSVSPLEERRAPKTDLILKNNSR